MEVVLRRILVLGWKGVGASLVEKVKKPRPEIVRNPNSIVLEAQTKMMKDWREIWLSSFGYMFCISLSFAVKEPQAMGFFGGCWV